MFLSAPNSNCIRIGISNSWVFPQTSSDNSIKHMLNYTQSDVAHLTNIKLTQSNDDLHVQNFLFDIYIYMYGYTFAFPKTNRKCLRKGIIHIVTSTFMCMNMNV